MKILQRIIIIYVTIGACFVVYLWFFDNNFLSYLSGVYGYGFEDIFIRWPFILLDYLE